MTNTNKYIVLNKKNLNKQDLVALGQVAYDYYEFIKRENASKVLTNLVEKFGISTLTTTSRNKYKSERQAKAKYNECVNTLSTPSNKGKSKGKTEPKKSRTFNVTIAPNAGY